MPITRRRRANPPDQPEGNNHITEHPADNNAEALPPEQSPATASPTEPEEAVVSVAEQPGGSTYQPIISTPLPAINGDRAERQEYTPPIEPGRRTARGELFRRPPQPPQQATAAPGVPLAPVPLQPPTHEINLPLGNLLHLAYNPGYTGSDESRGTLLHQLATQSKAGGRARCWNCGSIAIAYEHWNTRSKTFGEIGIAFCEICGVWSVM